MREKAMEGHRVDTHVYKAESEIVKLRQPVRDRDKIEKKSWRETRHYREEPEM